MIVLDWAAQRPRNSTSPERRAPSIFWWINACSIHSVRVADLSREEAEFLRRSITMLHPQAPSGLSRERALAILG